MTTEAAHDARMTGTMLDCVDVYLVELLSQLQPALLAPKTDTLERSLSQLGVESLGAIALQYRIHDRFGVLFPLEKLLSESPVRELGNAIRDAVAKRGTAPAGKVNGTSS